MANFAGTCTSDNKGLLLLLLLLLHHFIGVIRWEPSFLGVSLIGPRHHQRAQQQYMAWTERL